jgi:hypothetical protein
MADGTLFILFIEQQEKRSCSYYHKPPDSKALHTALSIKIMLKVDDVTYCN